MKLPALLLLSLALTVGGCQTAPQPVPPAPVPATPTFAAPATVPPAAPADTERKLLRQRQAIEALISQNDALTAELLALKSDGPRETNRMPVAGPVSEPPRPAVPPPPVTVPDSTPLLSANAEGVIDTVALQAPPQGTPVNPFAVRTQAAAAREISLTLQGIITGATPCALVNGRLLRPGDVLESLQLERVEAEAVFLRGDGFRLKLTPGEKPVRVRLPL